MICVAFSVELSWFAILKGISDVAVAAAAPSSARANVQMR